MTVQTAVIPAAGWGTRLLPATKAVPKELLPVLDKPVLQYVVEEAVASGIERIVVITSAGKEAMRRHLDNDADLEAVLQAKGKSAELNAVHDIAGDAELLFITQHEQKGLGDAVRLAREAVGDEPFAVMLGDTIIEPAPGSPAGTRQLIDAFERHGGSVVSVRQVPREWVSRYGIVAGAPVEGDDRTLRLDRLIEKPAVDEAPTNLAIAGRYVFTPAIFDHLADATAGHGGEIQLTDAMNALARDEPMFAHRWRAKRHDIGNKLDYVRCIIEMAARDGEIGPAVRDILNHVR